MIFLFLILVPCPNVFIQLNPIQLTLDIPTCLWLNSFARSILGQRVSTCLPFSALKSRFKESGARLNSLAFQLSKARVGSALCNVMSLAWDKEVLDVS